MVGALSCSGALLEKDGKRPRLQSVGHLAALSGAGSQTGLKGPAMVTPRHRFGAGWKRGSGSFWLESLSQA